MEPPRERPTAHVLAQFRGSPQTSKAAGERQRGPDAISAVHRLALSLPSQFPCTETEGRPDAPTPHR